MLPGESFRAFSRRVNEAFKPKIDELQHKVSKRTSEKRKRHLKKRKELQKAKTQEEKLRKQLKKKDSDLELEKVAFNDVVDRPPELKVVPKPPKVLRIQQQQSGAGSCFLFVWMPFTLPIRCLSECFGEASPSKSAV